MHSLVSLHSFCFPTSAKAILSIDSPADLQAQLSELVGSIFCILGEGSNTVFLEDYLGTIVTPAFKGINLDQTDVNYLVEVGAGENWHQFVSWCMRQKVYGLENLALIPGTVGAAPIQNIGAYGVEVEKFIQSVKYYDLDEQKHRSIDSVDCEFGYRDSIFKNKLADQVVITGVVFAIPKAWQGVTNYGELRKLDAPNAIDIFNTVVEIRQRKLPDPAKIGNAGSFFKNPIVSKAFFIELQQRWPSMPSYPVDAQSVKLPAAWLIDQLGFKGKKIGGIACHVKQALVLTNDGSGKGEQLLQLARQIKQAVQNEFSIVLENEVRLMGQNGLIDL